MNILSLDQALANTGVILYKDKVIQKITTIKTNNKELIEDRLIAILKNTEKLIEENNIDKVLMEKVYTPRGSAGAWHLLLMVEAVLKVHIKRLGISIETIETSIKCKHSWKYLLNLKNDKKEMLKLARQFYPKINEHEADALGILFAGLVINGEIHRDCTIQEFLFRAYN